MADSIFSTGENETEKAKELAAEIMSLSRNQLAVNFRFLDRVFASVKFVQSLETSFTADGRRIWYNPWVVLSMFRSEQTLVTRNMLHSLFHCVLRHQMVGPEIDRKVWDLACDAAVENAISDLGRECVSARRTADQRRLLEILNGNLPAVTAERAYRFIKDAGYTEAELDQLRLPFVGDDHGSWYSVSKYGDGTIQDMDLEQLWEEVSRRMLTELEIVMGTDDALTQNLRDLNRARYDYTEFLRRFGVRGEVMRLSEEEFDNNYYTYGLELYGNIPLIEPLEYRDEHKIRDFVIAIDTSGSVKGEVVQKFVQHTHDILARQENFETRVNMYIIQCDDRIRSAVPITCAEDFDRYLSEMQIEGLGETDFRPVFAYTDMLIREKKLTDLRGLIYFTDGKGIFPEKAPDYDTAFIIHDDGYSRVWVPDWAMKLYLNEEDILDDRFGR